MIFVVITICLFFVLGGLTCSRNNPFAPSVLTSLIWLCCLLLFLTVNHKLPDLSNRFFIVLSCWVVVTCVSSLLTQSVTYRQDRFNESSLLVRNIYLIISIAYVPSLLQFAQIALANGTSGNWALDLRLAALGKGSGFQEIFSGWQTVIWPVTYMLELLSFKKKTWWRFALALSVYSLFGVITMSKMVFLAIFLYTGSILFFKKVVKLKHVVWSLVPLFLVFVVLQMVRHDSQLSSVSSTFLRTYLLGNMSAFDTLTPCSAHYFGENTLRFMYAIPYKLGFTSTEPAEVILPWIEKPLITNTYTCMYPFYVDFGVAGILIFACFLGSLYGWTFKKALDGSNFNILVYAIFTHIIVTQYVAEMFFTNISGNLKMVLMALLPFYLTKHNILVCKEKVVSFVKS